MAFASQRPSFDWATRAYQQGEDEVCEERRQNFTTQVFRMLKVIERRPRPLYELEDLNGTLIYGQFYREELTWVCVHKVDKILNKRVRRCILEYLVRWIGYSKDFHSWIPASCVKDVPRRSEASKNLYPDNTIAAFTAELARLVELGSSDNYGSGYMRIILYSEKCGYV